MCLYPETMQTMNTRDLICSLGNDRNQQTHSFRLVGLDDINVGAISGAKQYCAYC